MKILLNEAISKENAYTLDPSDNKKIIPIVYDSMFKTMLNNENRKKYVALFLSYFIKEDYDYILNNIVFVKNDIDKQNYHEAQKTVDMIVKVDDKIYNIEMNNNATKSSLERNIDYANMIYRSKMKRGIKKYNYQYTIQININNFSFKGNNKSIEEYYIQNAEYVLTDKIKYIFIYLPNIRKKYYNKEKINALEKLMLVLNEPKGSKIEKEVKGEKIMEEYRKEAEEASEIQELWEAMAYDPIENAKMIREMDLNYAREDAKKEGARQTLVENALELYKNGVSKDIICKSLKISKEELDKILKDENSGN